MCRVHCTFCTEISFSFSFSLAAKRNVPNFKGCFIKRGQAALLCPSSCFLLLFLFCHLKAWVQASWPQQKANAVKRQKETKNDKQNDVIALPKCRASSCELRAFCVPACKWHLSVVVVVAGPAADPHTHTHP